jgi:hypothetical protein
VVDDLPLLEGDALTSAPGLKSPPAQNARPAPASSTTVTSGSASASRVKRASSWWSRPFTAFRRSGRFKVTTATPFGRFSISIAW